MSADLNLSISCSKSPCIFHNQQASVSYFPVLLFLCFRSAFSCLDRQLSRITVAAIAWAVLWQERCWSTDKGVSWALDVLVLNEFASLSLPYCFYFLIWNDLLKKLLGRFGLVSLKFVLLLKKFGHRAGIGQLVVKQHVSTLQAGVASQPLGDEAQLHYFSLCSSTFHFHCPSLFATRQCNVRLGLWCLTLF